MGAAPGLAPLRKRVLRVREAADGADEMGVPFADHGSQRASAFSILRTASLILGSAVA